MPDLSVDRELKRFLVRVFGLSLIFYLLTAVFSIGFFSWDEHYQTLEFLSPRLGRGTTADLPWEYAQAARPWFQPALYYALIRGLRAIGIENAATWTLVLRLFSGILNWLSMLLLTLVSFRWFESSRSRRIAAGLAACLCFLPFLGVRTSSESLSAAAFFLGLSAYFLGPRAWGALLAGLLMGAAIQFRYQDALMVLAFLGFCAYRKEWRNLAWIAGGLALVGVAGFFVDSWGYGQWTFVPWNYFQANIIQGKANAFSQDPVWFYLARYAELMPPIGALAFLGMILGWFRRPLHVLTFVTVPFFLIHCLITHKEVRFLFPIAPAVPFLVTFAIEALNEERFRRAWRSLRWALVPANFALLVIFAFKPAYSPFLLYSFVGGHPGIREIYYRDEDPFVQIRSLPTSFFKPPGTRSLKLSTYPLLEETLIKNREIWVFEGAATLPAEAGPLRNQCRLAFSAFPGWLNTFDFIPGIRFANRRSLFLCRVSDGRMGTLPKE